MDDKPGWPERIRVSIGSAIVLDLSEASLDAVPTTAYLMTYKQGRCSANCGFCPQARKSSSRGDMLSRVSWPVFSTRLVVRNVVKAFHERRVRRVCIQALNYPEVFDHLCAVAETVHGQCKIPISVSCQPMHAGDIARLAEAGVERIGIPVDAATEELFDKIKGSAAGGPYNWERQFKLLSQAVVIFGEGKVTTHLIVGLGETEKDMVAAVQRCVDMGVLPGLFAFTPVRGTILQDMDPPQIETYRRIQIVRHLIVRGNVKYDDVRFDLEGRIVDFGTERKVVVRCMQRGIPFQTSGCPDCNRPYYNEKPTGPIYNFPRELNPQELSEIEAQLGFL